MDDLPKTGLAIFILNEFNDDAVVSQWVNFVWFPVVFRFSSTESSTTIRRREKNQIIDFFLLATK